MGNKRWRRWVVCAGMMLAASLPARGMIVNVAGADENVDEANPPGFQLQKEDSKAVGKLEDFDRYVAKKAWELAFRTMSGFTDAEGQGMVPAGDGFMIPMRRRIAQSLKNLPAEGRDAYRLFYDAEAKQLWGKLDGEKTSTSEELQSLQKIVGRYFLTSVGDLGGDRLGDLYFEQGDFGSAAGVWEQVARDYPDSHISAAKLEIKRCIALSRLGRWEELGLLVAQVRERYGGQMVTIGGKEVEAGAFAESLRTQTSAAGAQSQPADGVKTGAVTNFPSTETPTWQVRVTSPETLAQMDAQLRQNWGWQYMQFAGTIPSAASDDKRVYINWLGAIFAVDLETGKMLWRTGKFSDITSNAPTFVQNGIDPRRFAVSLAGGKVFALTSDMRNNGGGEMPYQVNCMDPATGKVLWKGDKLGAGVSLVTLPYVIGETGYAVGTMRDQTLYLMAFKLETGTKDWNLALGKPQANTNYRGVQDVATPTLQGTSGMMYVATNNGALVAVNTTQRRVEWAFRHETKTFVSNRGGWNPDEIGNRFEMPGTLISHEGILYLKDTGGHTMYAVDPSGPALQWKRATDTEDTVIAIEGKTAYLLGHQLKTLDMKTRTMVHSSQVLTTSSNILPLMTAEHIYVSTARGIYDLNPETLETLRIFRGADHEASGGRLFIAGDKLICVSDLAVTAYSLAKPH